MFGLGDVKVLGTDRTDGACMLVNVEKPHMVAELVREHMRRQRQRALYIEQV